MPSGGRGELLFFFHLPGCLGVRTPGASNLATRIFASALVSFVGSETEALELTFLLSLGGWFLLTHPRDYVSYTQITMPTN
jgi:hypothetical protein